MIKKIKLKNLHKQLKIKKKSIAIVMIRNLTKKIKNKRPNSSYQLISIMKKNQLLKNQ